MLWLLLLAAAPITTLVRATAEKCEFVEGGPTSHSYSGAPRPSPDCAQFSKLPGVPAAADVAGLVGLLADKNVRVRSVALLVLAGYTTDTPKISDPALAAKIFSAIAAEKHPELRERLGMVAGLVDVAATHTLPKFQALLSSGDDPLLFGFIGSLLVENNSQVPGLLKAVGGLIVPIAGNSDRGYIVANVVRTLALLPGQRGCPVLSEALAVKDDETHQRVTDALKARCATPADAGR